MANAKSKNSKKMGNPSSNTPRTSYEAMGLRIQKEILAPKAQRDAHVIIERQPNDLWEDWDRFIDEIATNEEVSLRELGSGRVELKWEKYKPDKK